MKFILAAFLAFIIGAVASPLSDIIVGDINMITGMSSDLRAITENIGFFNVFIEGPKIARGFAQISAAATNATSDIQASLALHEDSHAVIDVLVTFVQVHQLLLSAVIGKHGLLAAVGFAEPIRKALVTLEQVVDTLAFAIIALLSVGIDDATAQAQSLIAAIERAIQTFS
ncbi:hypothetical protein AURDEDRAFT_158580 [Auricularia subglabra TFB-10046 SS5]|nr:hypothetical protein AURDEDRAFT_158580 [Auricularia subglabra TFB-10046 SS5]